MLGLIASAADCGLLHLRHIQKVWQPDFQDIVDYHLNFAVCILYLNTERASRYEFSDSDTFLSLLRYIESCCLKIFTLSG